MHAVAVALPSLLLFGAICAMPQAAPRAAVTPVDVERRVESILGQMTLEEKVDLIGGVDFFFVRGVPRLGVPRLKMADGPIGVRNWGPATAMAAGVSLAATWNPALAERVGAEIGRDARAKGVHFLLGPGLNIYRAPMNGRNFEYFGEDPFLAARTAVGYVKGVQAQGVSATVKHFIGNNSEFDRHNTDSLIDERTMREIYLPAFEAAVKEAGVGAIMCSYNLTNGAHMSQNGRLNTDVAKKEWGFRGVLMSDWDATYDGVAAANGGLDLEMPSGRFMNRETLLPAIQQGKLSVATLDDKVRRILRTAITFGWLDRDQTDPSIPRYNLKGREVALEAAREGIVLLKNDGGLLPLDKNKIKSIALIGPDAFPAEPVGGGSARVEPFVAVSILEGLGRVLQPSGEVLYQRGLRPLGELAVATEFATAATGGQPGLRVELFDNPDLAGTPTETRVDQRSGFPDFVPFGPPLGQGASARTSGYFTPKRAGTHVLFVHGAGESSQLRLYLDDQLVIDGWNGSRALVAHASVALSATPHKVVLEQRRARGVGLPRLRLGVVQQDDLVDPAAKALAAKADIVVVAAGFDPQSESEGSDRTFRLPPGQDELIQAMVAANKNAVVLITSGGGVDMNEWLDRVPALVQAWYPGQEGGTALADVLFGKVNPSGRLPVTFERRWEDNPVHDSYYPAADSKDVAYKEGVFVGYRGYEHNHTRPLFPFGYGLSYTTFTYGNLAVTPAKTKDGRVRVAFDVTNTGSRAGSEVAQVYVGDTHAKVPRPPKELKGFAKVSLAAGETQRVTVDLDRRSFSYYDVATKQWRAAPGEFDVLVGRSSEQIDLSGKVALVAGK
jgi:beta-glucosidase